MHWLDLSQIPLRGTDSEFLLSYGPKDRLLVLKNYLLKTKAKRKLLDSLKQVLYIRLQKEDFSTEGLKMATKMMVDIREFAEPYYEKGIEKGIEKGKLEDARRMFQEGLDTDVILRVTGLSHKQLKEAGILE